MFDTPRETIQTIGLGCLAITFLIIFFSLTRSPYEIIEGIVNWVKSTKKRKKNSKPVEGRHHVVEVPDGPDGKDDSQVADHQGDDGAHEDGKEQAA